jgi:peptidyl-prolyl cis-trans isomerase SurA
MIKKLFKKKKLLIIILLNIITLNNVAGIENKIILKIDNEIITSQDIENEIQYLKTLNPNIKNLSKERLILIGKNSLIREKIKKKEILRYMQKVEINKKFLNQLIKDRYLKLNFDSKDKFIEYLNKNQVDIDVIENKFSIEAMWNQIIYKKFLTKVKINQDALKEKIKIEKNQKNKSYLLSEIFFTVKNKNNLKNKYQKIKAVIENDSFESAALSFSISDSTAVGGKLGWVKEKSLNKTIKDSISKLGKNNYTSPIFVSNGYLILKINDIKFERIKYDEERELKIAVNYETNQQLSQYSNFYFNKIKKNITINEF